MRSEGKNQKITDDVRGKIDGAARNPDYGTTIVYNNRRKQMTDYTTIDQEVDAVSDLIWDMASNVWEFAELGYQEFKSSAYECEALEKNGFAISDRGIGGLDTAWIATWGSGSPVLGYLVEFDALPGLGNDTVPKKQPAKSGNPNGHGGRRHGTPPISVR